VARRDEEVDALQVEVVVDRDDLDIGGRRLADPLQCRRGDGGETLSIFTGVVRRRDVSRIESGGRRWN
jgi:hypothetical protein